MNMSEIPTNNLPASILLSLPQDVPGRLVEEEVHTVDQTSETHDRIHYGTSTTSAKAVTPLSCQKIFRNTGSNDESRIDSSDCLISTIGIVSFSSDEDDMSIDPFDSTTPLDYRRDWSSEIQNSFQHILRCNEIFVESKDDDNMDCDSISSIDMSDTDSVYDDDWQEPISQWIESEDIIW